MDVASSSSSSLPTIDVFLNFRGEDTRKNFVCHLLRALDWRGVKAYLDKLDLKTGDDLSDLQKAIAESKISIVVFSKNYATSTWCLKELVQILECKAKQKQIVMPIFYRVDPSDIRKQTGSFAKAFAEHEEDQTLLQEVQTWRSALRKAANIAGWNSEDYEDDAQLIDVIVKEVYDKVNPIPPHTQDGLIAMDSHLREMRRRLSSAAPDEIVYIGIWGMGGVGKTIIADAFYREIAQQFDHRCFLKNVSEGLKKDEVQMQLQFLSQLSGIWKEKINAFENRCMMLNRLRNKKILVVLDDVIDSSQIDTLLGEERSFGGGSIIIVTTRYVHVVRRFKIYEPQLLSYHDALKLFSQNAFKTHEPFGGYEYLSMRIVEYAHGLPLALKVLGRLLRDRSVSEWADRFKKMGKRPNQNIREVLKISYDELDESQQNRFLDIACFFKGMEREYVATVLVNCGASYANSELDDLVERALVTISDSNKLEMHDLLQEMGRDIESTKEVGKRSRFWSEAEPVLSENPVSVLSENPAMEYAEGLRIDLPNQEGRSFNAKAFVRMRKLKLLIFTYGHLYAGADGETHLTGDFNFLSHELRVLIWHGYPLNCLPSGFDPKNLVQLDMPYSNIERLWEGSKSAEKLISINLRGSPHLKKMPDLTRTKNLKKLHFDGCSSLTEVHPSILACKNRISLSVTGCTNLKFLPSSIHMEDLA